MSKTSLLFAGWLLLSASLISPPSSHAELRPPPETDLQAVETLLRRPEAELDLGEVKLAIDKRVEPRIDIEATRRRLDGIAAEVLEMLPPAPSRHERFEALHAYLYRAGDWNGQRPYLRDTDDPACQDIANKLLATHLVTRRGDCVSMALLVTIVGQRLGLDISLATAPQQLGVLYRDEAGVLRILDPTSGELKADPSRPRGAVAASATGSTLRALSRRESAVFIAQLLVENLARLPGQEARRAALAELLRASDPRHVAAQPAATTTQVAQRERAR